MWPPVRTFGWPMPCTLHRFSVRRRGPCCSKPFTVGRPHRGGECGGRYGGTRTGLTPSGPVACHPGGPRDPAAAERIEAFANHRRRRHRPVEVRRVRQPRPEHTPDTWLRPLLGRGWRLGFEGGVPPPVGAFPGGPPARFHRRRRLWSVCRASDPGSSRLPSASVTTRRSAGPVMVIPPRWCRRW